MTIVHVVPTLDVIVHDEDGGASCDCICGPYVEVIDDSTIVVHQSLHGRKLREDGAA